MTARARHGSSSSDDVATSMGNDEGENDCMYFFDEVVATMSDDENKVAVVATATSTEDCFTGDCTPPFS